MKLTKKQKEIMKEDIRDLNYLIDTYIKENKFEKASECLKELRSIEDKLIGHRNKEIG